jgi:Skp family chaperone for outer membrane proteins
MDCGNRAGPNNTSKGVLNVKNLRWIAVFLTCQAVTILSATSPAAAQTRVAIVDIGTIFKGHPVFTQQLDALRQDAETFKSSSVQLQQQLMQKAEVLKQYQPGSAEFKEAESSLAQESAAMEVEQRNKMRTLMQAEAQLHFDTYAAVNEIIAEYCDAQNIQLVLRYNGDPIDPKAPNTIMQRVNGSIIYHAPHKDITPQILAAIVQKTGTANAGAATTQR